VTSLPVIDVAPLVRGAEDGETTGVARAIDAACRDTGFFYVVGHGVDERLQERLEDSAREFFALDDSEKSRIAMARGGPAWRGWFPVGGELTSGVPDRKEGLYFGAELPTSDPRVRAGRPLHGPNLFPARPAGLRDAVLDYLDAMTALGHALARGIALALGLDGDWFARHLTSDPLVLFRVFHYPPGGEDDGWGVGEHTDYGLLTILRQDGTGGLQVRTRHGWWDAPPLPGSFVCNLGDMLDRMTGGRYRSTPHRVRNTGAVGRLSFPFFFDPSWDAEVLPVPLDEPAPPDDATGRWDGESVHRFEGTYGDYLLGKVGKVFPALRERVLE
jgi:isopenicillin N synthase-like dioxygenase